MAQVSTWAPGAGKGRRDTLWSLWQEHSSADTIRLLISRNIGE
jgi:hypothetical protein